MKLSFLKADLPRRATLVVVALALVAGVVTGREKPSAAPVEPVDRIATKIELDADIDLSKLERPAPSAPQADPFARRSFAAPPPAAAPAGPAKPAAPPLPFRYLGKLTENGRTEVFLLRGDDIVSIAPGQKIDAEYRVERISETEVSMTFLPLGTRQSLELAQ